MSDRNTESFKESLAPLTAEGGGYAEEAHVDAVRSILNEEGGNWSDKEKGYAKIIIVMTDTEPNEGDEAAAVLSNRAKREGVVISSILFLPTSVSEKRAEVSLRNYADTTGGVYSTSDARNASLAIQNGLSVCVGVNPIPYANLV